MPRQLCKNAHAELERRVAERTIAQQKSNRRLEQEVAARTRSEQGLGVSQGRWRSLVTDAPAIIIEIDMVGSIVFGNRGLLGMSI